MARRRAHDEQKLFEGLYGDCDPPATYKPLASVWDGTDAELLERMLDFYPRERPALILDATVNVGRFWAGSQRQVVGLDIDPKFRPDVVADNRRQPFKDGCFDVIVYDPPHIPNQGSDRSKDFNTRFGLVLKSSAKNGYNFTYLYPPFLREAFRVLRQEGVLLCKVADYIHNHCYQWAHIEVIRAATEAGFRPCDCIIKVRKGPIVDPKWKMAHHARRQHCYWIVLRKSNRCE
jgi:SAM-dependent methyltransferase